ncbi:MAG: PAS domain-containing protein [Candidatus Heimdallarchaeum endolithica]|uniref:PAS domain-containing protein n=1 Tax=Candidatus Heimdallarchaeum endolithica TaxID=2876572 RepID=A0A9Y1BR80_9ARCH|nr:MAG: PAS domain-containing protein [Candidatus Heimdallarchaeum endolithica]
MNRNFLNFVDRIKKQRVVDYLKIKKTIDGIFNLVEFEIKPSIILISFITSEDNQYIDTFFCSEGEEKIHDYDVYLSEELFSTSMYKELMFTGSIKYGKVFNLPFSEGIKSELIRTGYTDVIIVAIKLEEEIVGFVSVLFSNTENENKLEFFFSYIEYVSGLISSIVSSWYKLYLMEKEKNKSNVIIELSELALETTNIPIILKSLFKRIFELDNFYSLGLFRIKKSRFELYQGINISEQLADYFSEQDLKIETLPYYNHQNLLDETLATAKNQYCLIIPVKSANIFLGFLFIVTQPGTKISPDVENFLRIITNQLFLILQRRLLLDDIQAVTQMSELSFFPVFILDKSARIIYVNYQFEKIFRLKHTHIIGNKIYNVLLFNADEVEKVENAINSVLKTLKKESIKLCIKVEDSGQMRDYTYFANLSPTINNLTGEYCVVFSLLDVTESEKLRALADEYNIRSQMYLNVLTHDIFNIFFAIEGYYEIVKGEIPKEQKQVLNKVSDLVERGTETVQHIRLLSKVLNTTVVEKKSLLPLRTILETIEEKVKRVCRTKNIKIENAIPTSVKIRGTYFVIDFFEYIVTNLIKSTTAEQVVVSYSHSYDEDIKKTVLSINVKGEIDQKIIDSMKDVIISSDLEYGVRKQLWLQVVKEIAKRNEFEMSVDSLNINDTPLGVSFKVLFEGENE